LFSGSEVGDRFLLHGVTSTLPFLLRLGAEAFVCRSSSNNDRCTWSIGRGRGICISETGARLRTVCSTSSRRVDGAQGPSESEPSILIGTGSERADLPDSLRIRAVVILHNGSPSSDSLVMCRERGTTSNGDGRQSSGSSTSSCASTATEPTAARLKHASSSLTNT
jgi:hypothetical protein